MREPEFFRQSLYCFFGGGNSAPAPAAQPQPSPPPPATPSASVQTGDNNLAANNAAQKTQNAGAAGILTAAPYAGNTEQSKQAASLLGS